MGRLIIGFVVVLVCNPFHADAAVVVAGEIWNIDGDNDGFVDDLEVARILFDVSANTYAVFDTLIFELYGEHGLIDLNGDGEATAFDGHVHLFLGETLIMSRNDYFHGSPLNQDGSLHSNDPAFSLLFNTAGTYMLSLGRANHTLEAGLRGYEQDQTFLNLAYSGDNSHGDWQLTIRWDTGSVSNVRVLDSAPVPEPSAIVIWSLIALTFAGIDWRRRRKSQV